MDRLLEHDNGERVRGEAARDGMAHRHVEKLQSSRVVVVEAPIVQVVGLEQAPVALAS